MSHKIKVEENVYLHVEDIGSGRPVVFLHGWPANIKMYEYQLQQVVAQGYRFIGIDQRGFGKSDASATGYDYDTMVDDIQKVVDELQLKDYMVVGFSVGGAMALKYGAKHANPELKKMVLLGPAGPSFVQRKGYPYGMKEKEVTALIEQINDDMPKALGGFGKVFFDSKTKVSKEYMDYFNNLTLTSTVIGTAKVAESLRDEDLREDVKTIQIPVYGIHGKDDKVCPIDFSKYLEKNMPHYEFTPVAKAGHALFFEQKEQVTKLLLEYLAK